MFTLAILIGIYSYLIFFLGILGLLYRPVVLITTVIYFSILIIFAQRKLKAGLTNFGVKKLATEFKSNKLFSLTFLLIISQALINLIGVFGPEISFDALWYHLTLPKLYIIHHAIFYIPGSNLFYSAMPKLTEMLYTAAMILVNDNFAKLIHFSFGILTIIAIYKISRKFMSKDFSILASAIFYANLVVGWETITAYVDLSWVFFSLMAFWGLLIWLEKRNKRWLVLTGIMFGLAVTVKLVALFALPVFLLILIYDKYLEHDNWLNLSKGFFLLVIITLLVPLPWLIFAFVNTGNPVYPYLSNQLVDSGKTLVLPNYKYILTDLYNFFLKLNDPISPIYLIVLPLIVINFKKFSHKVKILTLYCFGNFLIWYLTQEPRGGRFILPYLSVFSILAAYVIAKVKRHYLKNFLIAVVIFITLISIGYRSIANAKFVPVELGRETKSAFLSKYLNFSFGDFYDTDNYFQNHLTKNDTVLLYGFGKLYYVDFNFIDSSWVKSGDKFDYIAVQNSVLPKRFSDWRQIYYNKLTKVKLYTKGEKICVY
jgi:hypothetical protein